jgi:hypothetical protein
MTMRPQPFGILVLSICLVDGTIAKAQFQLREAPQMWQQGVGIVGISRVRDELKLTADQLTKLREIGEEFLDKHRRPYLEAGARGLTIDERTKKREALMRAEQEAAERAKSLLTPEQSSRVRQIELWLRGPLAFTEPDVAKELDLTATQTGTLTTIGQEYENEDDALVKSLNRRTRLTKEELAIVDEERAKVAAKRDALRATKEGECVAVLTDSQLARFKKLRGEKYDTALTAARTP